MATEFILIRHGHSVRVRGNYANAPLTELGRAQAARTGQRLLEINERFDAFYVSPLRRARETATIIGARIKQAAVVKPGVQEMESSELLPIVVLELLAARGFLRGYLDARAGKPLRWPIIGRVAGVLTELSARHPGQRVVLVTHGGVISGTLAWYFPRQRQRWWRETVDNCSLTRLRAQDTRAELLAINDIAHLQPDLTTAQQPALAVEAMRAVETPEM